MCSELPLLRAGSRAGGEPQMKGFDGRFFVGSVKCLFLFFAAGHHL
jgi:hypothetical protein